MAQVTGKGGLVLPANGEAADNDVLNANFERIAQYGMGAFESTSTSRPAAPWGGLTIRETDTGFIRVWDGTKWAYVQGDSHGEWIGPTNFGIAANSVTFGTGALSLDSASSSPVPQLPGNTVGASEYIQFSEPGDYYVEGIAIWTTIFPAASWVELTCGAATATETLLKRTYTTNVQRGDVEAMVRAPVANYKVAMRLTQADTNIRNVNVRLKATRT